MCKIWRQFISSIGLSGPYWLHRTSNVSTMKFSARTGSPVSNLNQKNLGDSKSQLCQELRCASAKSWRWSETCLSCLRLSLSTASSFKSTNRVMSDAMWTSIDVNWWSMGVIVVHITSTTSRGCLLQARLSLARSLCASKEMWVGCVHFLRSRTFHQNGTRSALPFITSTMKVAVSNKLKSEYMRLPWLNWTKRILLMQ